MSLPAVGYSVKIRYSELRFTAVTGVWNVISASPFTGPNARV